VSNTKGRIHFARAGPGTRSNQLSIMRKDNAYLDSIDAGRVVGFPPIAEIVEGIEVIDALNERYGNEPATHQDSIRARGREYLDRVYPGLDVILRARLVDAPKGPPPWRHASISTTASHRPDRHQTAATLLPGITGRRNQPRPPAPTMTTRRGNGTGRQPRSPTTALRSDRRAAGWRIVNGAGSAGASGQDSRHALAPPGGTRCRSDDRPFVG